MATVSPENNKFIYSRIHFELANAIKTATNNQLHIDDALIAAGTPVVLLTFKHIEKQDLKQIMLALQPFLKRHPRFMEFTKQGVAEGLRKEWLPTLDDEEKASMLTDFKLTEEGVDNNGFIIFNQKIFENLTKNEHPDHERYGMQSYTAISMHKSRAVRIKEYLTSVKADKNLKEKLIPYIEWYKNKWNEIHPLEKYKWEAIEHFQHHFNLEAEDLAANLKEAFRKAGNLLSGSMYTPLSMLVKHASISPDEVRIVLSSLYDENKPLNERVIAFLEDFKEIHSRNRAIGHFRPTDTDQQSERAISVYLAFRFPDKHFLYKSSVWNGFKNESDLDYPPLNHFIGKLYGYELISAHIKDLLKSDQELMNLLKQSEPHDISEGNLLTQDFMYAVSVHLKYSHI